MIALSSSFWVVSKLAAGLPSFLRWGLYGLAASNYCTVQSELTGLDISSGTERQIETMASIIEEEAMGEAEFAGGNPIPNEEPRADHRGNNTTHSDAPLSAANAQDHEKSLNHDPEKGLPEATAETSNEKTQEEKDPNIIDWNGPDDPDKPINWPTKKKWPNVAVISALTFLTYV